MVPFFKTGDFGGGLIAGVQAITARTDPKFDSGATATQPERWSEGRRAPFPFNVFIIIIFVVIYIARRFFGVRNLGLFTPRYGAGSSWGSSRSSWGGGGGSSWGGGGGGFSGGGASGKW
jgi:uncharacterized protein